MLTNFNYNKLQYPSHIQVALSNTELMKGNWQLLIVIISQIPTVSTNTHTDHKNVVYAVIQQALT